MSKTARETWAENIEIARHHQALANEALEAIILDLISASNGGLTFNVLHGKVCTVLQDAPHPAPHGEFEAVLRALESKGVIMQHWTARTGTWVSFPADGMARIAADTAFERAVEPFLPSKM